MQRHPLERLLALLLCCLLCWGTALAEYSTLKIGSKGAAVSALKQRLYELGYYQTSKLQAYYNDNTADHVRDFQRKNGLEQNGIASPELQELLFSDDAIRADGLRADGTIPDEPEGEAALSEAQRIVASQQVPYPEDMPEANADGFLDSGEYVSADEENGLWIYVSAELRVEIRRYTDTDNKLEWFETDIRTRTGEQLYTPHVEKATNKYKRPQEWAKQNQAVLAITDDFYTFRVRNKQKPGVIIRGGEILSDNSRKKGAGGWPKEEILAYFPDGRMQTFDVGEHTAEEYIEMGVTETFAFGPILVRNGQPGEDAVNLRYYHYREPRCALGMVEPNHFVILTVKGREKDIRGCYLDWLAYRMLELGVREALNLDGGGTTALVFMGELLNYKGKNNRAVGSVIAFGHSSLVSEGE